MTRRPIAVVLLEPLVVHEAAERIELAADRYPQIVFAAALVQVGFHVGSESLGEQVERLLVHRAPVNRLRVFRLLLIDPAERVERAVVGRRVAFEPLLEQPGDRALAAADRAVQQQHAAFDAVTRRGALERIHQMVQRSIEPKDGVVAVVVGVVEEAVVDVVSRDPIRSRPLRTTRSCRRGVDTRSA